MITTIRHPRSGERFAVEIGPSDLYNGQDRILRVEGPLNVGETADQALSGRTDDDQIGDAEWLSRDLGFTVDLRESDVYGEDLHGLLRSYSEPCNAR